MVVAAALDDDDDDLGELLPLLLDFGVASREFEFCPAAHTRRIISCREVFSVMYLVEASSKTL